MLAPSTAKGSQDNHVQLSWTCSSSFASCTIINILAYFNDFSIQVTFGMLNQGRICTVYGRPLGSVVEQRDLGVEVHSTNPENDDTGRQGGEGSVWDNCLAKL